MPVNRHFKETLIVTLKTIIVFLIFKTFNLFFKRFLAWIYLSYRPLTYDTNLTLQIIDYITSIVVPIILMALILRINPFGKIKNFKPKQLLLLLIVPIFTYVKGYSYLSFLHNFPQAFSEWYKATMNVFGDLIRPHILSYEYSVWWLGPIVIAAIKEELFFRVLLGEFIYRKTKNPILMIVIPGIMFMLLHYNPFSVGYFFSGLLFGYLYYKTRNPVIPILAHSLSNLLKLTFFSWFEDLISDHPDALLSQPLTYPTPSFYIHATLMSILFVTVIIIVWRNILNNHQSNDLYKLAEPVDTPEIKR